MFVEGGGAKKKFLQEGDVLFNEGDPGDAAFNVDSGLIGIYKLVEGEKIELGTLKVGELFGEMAIVDGSKRMAHAVAKEESVVIVIPASTVESRLAKVDPFLRALMKILVNNLRSVHQAYMKRARSVNDYMNAIQFHTEGFRMYLTRSKDSPLSADGLEKLDQIDALLLELRATFKDHPDPRNSALGEADLTRRKSKE
jgi:CRP/FNR family cyclic AMP-dependent transcriptional regulator